jgi:predicted NBD/HSP70 family sugar kinase
MGSGASSIEQQTVAVTDLLVVEGAIAAPLDPGFAPVVLAKKKYREAAKDCKESVHWRLTRPDGCAAGELKVFPADDPRYGASVILAGIMIQESIWRCGATSLKLCGPPQICNALQKAYSKGGTYEFEADVMPKAFGTPDKPFVVEYMGDAGLEPKLLDDLPKAKDTPQVCGKDAGGCRLAFDLGKSDIKTVAIKDGEVLDSMETEWDVTNVDPEYHFKAIVDAMQATIERAKAKGFGDIQAVGGSATGTVSGDNEATWCDIFPNVPQDVYKEKVVDIFKRIAKEVAGDVPLKVINDGEVTALAAVQKIGKGNVMGISMGSSEGGGYANEDGNLMGWINELCYMKLDMNPRAPTDPWTKGAHRGMSHMYLGQRGATKNAWKICEVPENYRYPHADMCTIKHEDHSKCLKLIQDAYKNNPDKAADLYKTCGVYLGYGLANYCEHYKIEHVMILGRVSKGDGGDLMLKTASEVLEKEFPELPKITFHTADDHFKAVGQCIAAAALPVIG